ncbi:MFS transporter [Actinopolyspora mortivallis]|uniref:MFS transporter n=1 Tax=Actinopolyspora mortivallis TaxID=33906 RepID=UPI00036D9E0D|nr:MFS transporter [Actinopolyspora mortivallis]
MTTPQNPPRQFRRNPLVILTVVASVGFVTALDNTVVAVIAPSVGEDFAMDLGTLQWVSIAYMLPYAGLVLVAGAVLDRLGDRALFAGLVLFCVGAVLCGLSWNAVSLLLGRILQGISAAVIVPGTLGLLRTELPGGWRATAAATWTAALAAALASGPWLGGLVARHAHWSWIFHGNVLFVAPAVALLLARGVSGRGGGRRDPVRLSAALAVTTGLTLLLAALVTSAEGELGVRAAVLLGGAGGVVLCGFVLAERRSTAPLVPPRLVTDRLFAGSNSLLVLWGLGISGVVFFTPLLHQRYLGLAPDSAGLPLVLVAVGVVLATPFVPRATRVFGVAAVVACGLATVSVGLFLLASVNHLLQLPPRFPALLVIGLGSALTAPLTSHALEASGESEAGGASGVLTASREVSSAFGVALIGAVISVVLARGIDSDLDRPEALASGYTHGLVVAAVLQGIAALAALPLLRPKDPERGGSSGDTDPAPEVSAAREEGV